LIEKKLSQNLFLENHRIYLVGWASEDLQFLSWPSGLNRFVLIDTGDEGMAVAFVEDIIRLAKSEQESTEWYAVKMSRDAELFVEEEQGTTISDKVKASLANRDIGLPARLLYDQQMPASWLKTLKKYLELSKYDLIPGARYHHFSDFFHFPLPEKATDLRYRAFPSLKHPLLEKDNGIWESIQVEDQLLSFPYQKFDYLLLLLEECIADPRTRSIQMTIYRTGEKSPVVDLLLKALEKGIEVFVFMEVKARFDEEPNLYWGEELEKRGAEVRYSYVDLKVHTKCLLIERHKDESLAWIGTGNFNHKTAKIYADHALLTCNRELAEDLTRLFNALKKRKVSALHFKHLWVAPFNLRQNISQAVENEIRLSEKGLKAWMVLKMNNLEDPMLIRLLYKASGKGVKITLLVRGICCLNPEHPDAENIRILSMIDRFLEHARIYLFGNGGKEKMYLGSADWMTRNMDRRVEVVTQINNKKVFRTLRHLLSLQAKDNVKNRLQQHLLKNERIKNDKDNLRAQEAFYYFLSEIIQ
jgi:polyphosphate kinase